jgi:hypothetical protein
VRDRPAIVVRRLKRGRVAVSVDLHCTERSLTPAGWATVVDAFKRHGSSAMARVRDRGFVFADYAFGIVDWPVADRLARELLAITSAGSFVQVCHRPPEEADRR